MSTDIFTGRSGFFTGAVIVTLYNGTVERHSTHHTIGILSDTHIETVNDTFRTRAEWAFGACDTIIHAGDLTDHTILDVFGDKRIIAVHGNMCTTKTRTMLPSYQVVSLAGFTFAVCHGDRCGHDIEQRLFSRFHEADCIIYGHTHQPINHLTGGIRFINPGSFRSTGRYGNPGSFALITIDERGLFARLQTLPPQL